MMTKYIYFRQQKRIKKKTFRHKTETLAEHKEKHIF